MANTEDIKTALMLKHRDLTSKGRYRQARYILHLLNKGYVSLGLSDDAWYIEDFFIKLGMKASYNRKYTTAVYKL